MPLACDPSADSKSAPRSPRRCPTCRRSPRTCTGRGTASWSACSSGSGPAGPPTTHTRRTWCARRRRSASQALANDQAIVRDIAAAKGRLDAAITGPTWFADRDDSPLGTVAYFSPEFGLTEALPQYSGGLGVLAGDHLKASSDLGVPLVGVGLLYTEGYFHQELDADGWQQEKTLNMDPESLGLADTGVAVTVDLAGDPVRARVWRADVGKIAAVPARHRPARNSPDGIAVTDRLYGGDSHHRLRQEIILGIGGVRALRALGIEPEVFHMNEGHAGFLGLERIREHVAAGLPFAAAVEAVRGGGVFTTHTPVPAGIDRFDARADGEVLHSVRRRVRRDVRRAVRAGREPRRGADTDRRDGSRRTKFNMARDGPAPRRPVERRRPAARRGQPGRCSTRCGRISPCRRGADRCDHQRRARPQLDVEPCRRAAVAADRRRLVDGRRRPVGGSCTTSTRPRSGTRWWPGAAASCASSAACSARACSTPTRSRSGSPGGSPRTSGRRCCCRSPSG